MAALARVERICTSGVDDRTLRIALLDEIRRFVPFDSYVFVLTDPQTGVGTSPLADVPSLADLPKLIGVKYRTPVNRWTSLAPGQVGTLVEATDGDPARSALWRDLLAGYGVDDVASVVYRDQFGCWGFLDLWRRDGVFSPTERARLGELSSAVTAALRRCLIDSFAGPDPATPAAHPVVLLLSDDLCPLTQTPGTDQQLRALLPTPADRPPVPASALNVAAQLLARELGVDDNQPWARAMRPPGSWITLRADRLMGADPGTGTIAVTITSTPPSERAALYARVLGLSEREADLLAHLVAGCDTRELARRLFISEHTVQDHLKSIFAKAGTRSRRVLVARAAGTG